MAGLGWIVAPTAAQTATEGWTWRAELSEDTIYNDALSSTVLTFVAVYQADPNLTVTDLDVRLEKEVPGSDQAGASISANFRNPDGINYPDHMSYSPVERALDLSCTADLPAGTLTCRDSRPPVVAQRAAAPGVWRAKVDVDDPFRLVAIVNGRDGTSQIFKATITPLNSPTFTVLPAAVTELAAVVEDGAVVLSWQNASTNGVTGYEYRVSADRGDTWDPDWTPIPGSDDSTTSHRIAGLNDAELTFEVRAVADTLKGGVARLAPPQLVVDRPEQVGASAQAGAQAPALQVALRADGDAIPVESFSVRVRASGAGRLADIAEVAVYADANGNGQVDEGEPQLASAELDAAGRATLGTGGLAVPAGEEVSVVFALRFAPTLRTAGGIGLAAGLLAMLAWRGRRGAQPRAHGRTVAVALAMVLVLALVGCEAAVRPTDPKTEPKGEARTYQLTLEQVAVAAGADVAALPDDGITGPTVTMAPQ